MKKLLFAIPVLLALAGLAQAAGCRANVVAVKQQKVVAVKQQVVVQKQVVQKVAVAQVVTPVVQVSEVRAVVAYPYAAPLVAPYDAGRLDRIERAVERLIDRLPPK